MKRIKWIFFIAVIVRLFSFLSRIEIVHFLAKVFSITSHIMALAVPSHSYSFSCFFFGLTFIMLNIDRNALASNRSAYFAYSLPHIYIFNSECCAGVCFIFLLWCEQWTIEICEMIFNVIKCILMLSIWCHICGSAKKIALHWHIANPKPKKKKETGKNTKMDQCQTSSLVRSSVTWSNTCSNMLIWSMDWRIVMHLFVCLFFPSILLLLHCRHAYCTHKSQFTQIFWMH